MHFGQTLKAAVYPPYAPHYIDYYRLKVLLNENDDDSDAEDARTRPRLRRAKTEAWTDADESRFVEELINVQLEKVNNFQKAKIQELRERTGTCEKRLETIAEGLSQNKEGTEWEEEKGTVLGEVKDELEHILVEVRELGKFNRINYTGFLKAAKKHDRKMRALRDGEGKGKGKSKESGGASVRPLLDVRLAALEFNKDDPNPLLYRISVMFDFIRKNTKSEQELRAGETSTPQPRTKKYTSYKFWVHPDNVLEVKTNILRRLPVLIFNPERFEQISKRPHNPSINSIYFDNSKFDLYNAKMAKKETSSSLRLRWYGKLRDANEIIVERKTMEREQYEDGTVKELDDHESALIDTISIKKKYVLDFIHGQYSPDKEVAKIKAREGNEEKAEKFRTLANDLQAFIQNKNLEPMMRAVYTRTAFQIPNDDRFKVTLDTNVAFIREDALDLERPIRDPDDWHRNDLDDQNMEFPFPQLRKAEIMRFPYALLEMKVLDSVHRRREDREWLNEILSSHLVWEVKDFSKFAHGIGAFWLGEVDELPLWLSDLDRDIRKDPKQAWEDQQAKKQKEAEELIGIGSLTTRTPGALTSSRSYQKAPSIPPKALSSEEIPTISSVVAGASTTNPPEAIPEVAEDGDAGESSSSDEDDDESTPLTRRKKKSTLKKVYHFLFPRGQRDQYVIPQSQLPPGVTRPTSLIKDAAPLNIEPKVWLANQRTFLKWQHIALLLGALSIALFNAAGPKNKLAMWIGLAYTFIAIFTGTWGWWVFNRRGKLIRNRDGRDLDFVLGPVIITIGLIVGLVLNFTLRYIQFVEGGRHGHPGKKIKLGKGGIGSSETRMDL
ncbi:SPX-domain-containing protein [Ascobolus immersus RN42]|uniref:SPX-domain-containing protein n=1 Tax=Ascobolus immersus RN42 TaxID=1160509 RepID=A0A3N4IDK3_ASCIM|nr:SPX-domain-containing protein [Ascobolus immersus RN42]